jgi:hypothetical protein
VGRKYFPGHKPGKIAVVAEPVPSLGDHKLDEITIVEKSPEEDSAEQLLPSSVEFSGEDPLVTSESSQGIVTANCTPFESMASSAESSVAVTAEKGSSSMSAEEGKMSEGRSALVLFYRPAFGKTKGPEKPAENFTGG